MLNGKVSRVECEASIGHLSRILSDAYGSRVVVIIDEYDTPIQQGYNNGYYKSQATSPAGVLMLIPLG